ncbi:hypothetical protein LXL04_014940 [Taraxacum kok-saghyz]
MRHQSSNLGPSIDTRSKETGAGDEEDVRKTRRRTGDGIGRIKEMRKQKSNRKQKPLRSTAYLKPVQVVCSGEVPKEGVWKKGEREHRDEGHGAISGFVLLNFGR